MSAAPVVFVCGVTGTQGGAVSRALVADNVQVHALARDPASENAKAVESLGVKLWPGDYDDMAALNAAIEGCTSVFLNLSPNFQEHNAEMRWATNIITAARGSGSVKHLCYSSGFAVDNPQRLRHWDPESFTAKVLLGKQAIENATRSAGFQYWTILRPGSFMANYLLPLVRMNIGLSEHGVWSTALRPDTLMPLVATVTIGNFSKAVLLDPQRFHSKEIEYADEVVSIDALVAKLTKATGREIRADYLSEEEIEKQKTHNPFLAGQLAMRDMAQFLDMDAIKGLGIPFCTFDEFLAMERDRVEETYLAKSS